MIEQRKSQRFELKLPLEIIRAGSSESHGWCGETVNLSSTGVLFAIQANLPTGMSVEYVITLPGALNGGRAPRLRCMGKVVRHEPYGAAVTLERHEFLRS